MSGYKNNRKPAAGFSAPRGNNRPAQGGNRTNRPSYNNHQSNRTRDIKVLANLFPVSIDFGKSFFQYDVKIECEFTKANGQKGKYVVPKNLKDHYLKRVLDGKIDENSFLFNGDSVLYSIKKLSDDLQEIKFQKELPSESKKEQMDTYTVTITHARDLHYQNLADFIKNRSIDCQPEINLIDLVYRQNKLDRYFYSGRTLFDLDSDTIDLDGTGLFISTGHYQSLRLTSAGWVFNIDLKSGVFYRPMRLLEHLEKFFRVNPNKRLDPEQLKRIQKALTGVFVNVDTSGSLRFPIKGLGKPAVEEFFAPDESKPDIKISVAQYYKENYTELKYPFLPCVIKSQDQRRIVYPIEICQIAAKQKYMKALSQKQQTTMVQKSAYNPNDHQNLVNSMANAPTDKKLLQNFGICEVPEKKMITCNAKVLDPINVWYDSNQSVRTQNGQWRMANRHFWEPATLKNWCLIWTCEDKRSNRQLNQRIRDKLAISLLEAMERSGIKANRPDVIQAMDKSIETISEEISASKNKPELAVFIIDDRDDCYSRIKSHAELEIGLKTQCMRIDKLIRQMDLNAFSDDFKLNNYLDNVCKKINTKIGGTNSIVSFENMKNIQLEGEPVMFLGADVATSQSLKKSFAAVVGSYDMQFCKYSIMISEQINEDKNKSSQEIILKMEEIASSLIKKYEEKNRVFPKRIIYFRDGVDTGQFQKVIDHELYAIKRALGKLKQDPDKIPVTVVLVIKRHHFKFYPTCQQDTINSGNLVPGTVIDTDVTNPHYVDFFLISQQAGLGTARPTYYNVIHDENQFTKDDIEKLTFNLCHLYANCTKSVSIPSPVFYAHKAAYRGLTYSDYLDPTNDFQEFTLDDDDKDVVKTRLIEINSELQENMFFI